MTTTLKRQYAINKELARAYTNLKNLKQQNSKLVKKNRALVKKIKAKNEELNRISRHRSVKRFIDKRNKNINEWLRRQPY